MRYGCPNQNCDFSGKKDHIVKDGSYLRENDSRTIQRYKCKYCGKKFSNATFSLAKNQKKRRLNSLVQSLLSSSVSMRRIAFILGIHRITVKRKLIYLAKLARENHQKFLESIQNKVTHLQFDDLITIEHTKLKPVTASLAVDVDTRKILGIKVGKIPAFGYLAQMSRTKYGKRPSEHLQTLDGLFSQIKEVINDQALIESDEHKFYPGVIQKYKPSATHKRFKGGRSCIAGQGELKKLHYDPLFCLNHTCAMLRANVNRLVRKSWCTTKSIEMLQNHLDIFMNFYNTHLLKN